MARVRFNTRATSVVRELMQLSKSLATMSAELERVALEIGCNDLERVAKIAGVKKDDASITQSKA